MSKVIIEYNDSDALTAEEIVKNGKRIYGAQASIKVLPKSMLPHDLIAHALWQITAAQQTALFFNEKELYPKKLKELRAEVLYTLSELLDDVLITNEERLTKGQ